MKKINHIIFTILMFFVFSMSIYASEIVIITGDSVRFRTQPNTGPNSGTITYLNKNDQATLLDKTIESGNGCAKNWYKIRDIAKELNISDDDIQYVLDVIYDFYESKGLLNEDTDEEVEIVEEELLHYILKAVKKDEMDAEKLNEENVQLILDAEYEYSESLGVY